MSRTLRTTVAPRDPKGTRQGFTTGACAAAAAKAAARLLVRGKPLDAPEYAIECAIECAIVSTLPNGQQHRFVLEQCELRGDLAICSVVKDGGDDPDCTHGAEIVASVTITDTGTVALLGGEGVATVTKPGLGLEIGGPAINPVPRRNITDMVLEELRARQRSGPCGAVVTISVPGGVEMAKHTINARLGLLGGISILGTTGVVKPYSTAAYKASVVQAIDVARERGIETFVLTTGGKSEAYAIRMFPELPEEAFVQVGDFVGVGLKHCARRGARRAVVVGMIGKLSKMADGRLMTHAAGAEVNMALLATMADELGAPPSVAEEIRAANTARHVLELARGAGHARLPDHICARVVAQLGAAAQPLEVHAVLVDFDGRVLGRAKTGADDLESS